MKEFNEVVVFILFIVSVIVMGVFALASLIGYFADAHRNIYCIGIGITIGFLYKTCVDVIIDKF